MKSRDRTRETRKKDTQKLFQDMQKMHGNNEEMVSLCRHFYVMPLPQIFPPYFLPCYTYCFQNQETMAENLQSKLDHLAEAEKTRQKQIRDLEAKIQRMQEDAEQPLPEEVISVLEDRDGSIKRERVRYQLKLNTPSSDVLPCGL